MSSMPHFLNTWTGEFEWHSNPRKVVYAILSHTWRSPNEGGEQSYSDVRRLQMSVDVEPEQHQRRVYAANVDIIRCHHLTTPSQAKRVPPRFLLPKDQALLSSFVLYDPELSPKIKYACKVARSDGYRLLWIDVGGSFPSNHHLGRTFPRSSSGATRLWVTHRLLDESQVTQNKRMSL